MRFANCLLTAGVLLGLTQVILAPSVIAQEPSAAERGQKALFTRAFAPGTLATAVYDNAWKNWPGKPTQPAGDYAAAFAEYYGLHAAPFDNGRYPMGLREAPGVLVGKGLTFDCMLCHGGSILGKS